MQVTLFSDRAEAGRQLAKALAHLSQDAPLLVLGLLRGGVPVAYQVARALKAPLDVFLVRKLGLPEEEELAIGALASGGVRVLNEPLIRHLQLSPSLVDAIAARQEIELKRRETLFRADRSSLAIRDRTVILVDDGLATGSSMKAAAQAVRLNGPRRLAIAVPVAPPDVCRGLASYADEVLCLRTPEPFGAVGAWYENFQQVSDDEVRECLHQQGSLAAQPADQ